MKINSILYYNANMSLKYSEKYAKELLNLFFKKPGLRIKYITGKTQGSLTIVWVNFFS